MKLLDRYIGRQVLVTALFAITILGVVIVLGNVFKKLFDQIFDHNPPVGIVLSIIGYVLPFSLTFAIPWGVLTSVLLVFGRMSAENEITALRSSGVSITRLCVPVAIIAFGFAAICAWINLVVAPRAQAEMKAAVSDLLLSNPLAVFGNDKVIDLFDGQRIYVARSEGKRVENLLIYQHDDKFNLTQVMSAEEGDLDLKELPAKDGSKQMSLVLTYRNLRYEMIEQGNNGDPEDRRFIKSGMTASEGAISISLQRLYEKKKNVGGVGVLAVQQLMKIESREAVVELNKRYSLAMATLVFALLAIPLGITGQRKETSVGFVISLGIALSYFLLLIAADLARNRHHLHPELLVWLPNIIFLTIGGWRFAKLMRQ